jgi:hypothetical protein
MSSWHGADQQGDGGFPADQWRRSRRPGSTVPPGRHGSGNLYVEPGAECQIDGIVLGDVENAGHTVVRGTVVGSLVDVEEGYTDVHPNASIPGEYP